jgi:hypothetical protein
MLRKRPPLDGRRSSDRAVPTGGHHDDPEPARLDDPAVDVEVAALEFLPAETPQLLRCDDRRQCPEMGRCRGEPTAGNLASIAASCAKLQATVWRPQVPEPPPCLALAHTSAGYPARVSQ